MPEVPFADHGSLPAVALHLTGEVPQCVVEWSFERGHAVDVVVGAGQDGSPARRTDRIGAERCVKAHAFGRDAIQVRRVVDTAAIRRDCMGSMVITHDEDQVWLGLRFHRHKHIVPRSIRFSRCRVMLK